MMLTMESSWPKRPPTSLVTSSHVWQSTTRLEVELLGQYPNCSEQSSGARKYGKRAWARSGKWCSVNLKTKRLLIGINIAIKSLITFHSWDGRQGIPSQRQGRSVNCCWYIFLQIFANYFISDRILDNILLRDNALLGESYSLQTSHQVRHITFLRATRRSSWRFGHLRLTGKERASLCYRGSKAIWQVLLQEL